MMDNLCLLGINKFYAFSLLSLIDSLANAIET